MDDNTMLIEGEIVNIGEPPPVLRFCGFSCREEVRSVAARCSSGTPYMRMDDVRDWFKTHG